MQQWRQAKMRHADAIVLFRVGDFYEMFYDDAREGARLLGLTLTSRNNGGAADVPLAGVPVRARDEYVRKLVRLGKRVAICEQVEDPAEAKGLVRREVVETVTPGAVLSDALLSEKRNNFLVAMARDPAGAIALAAADVSTGELVAVATLPESLEADLARFEPAELLLPESWAPESGGLGPALEMSFAAAAPSASRTYRPDWLFDAELAAPELARRFRVHGLAGFGIGPNDAALVGALGALTAYLADVQPAGAAQLRPPRVERAGRTMALDEMTRRNLELVEPLRGGDGEKGNGGTLVGVLDETLTAMGARLLRRWLLAPLVDAREIWRRQAAVAMLVEDPGLRRRLRAELKEIRDLERLAAKVGTGRISPREMKALGDSLAHLPAVARLLDEAPGDPVTAVTGDIDTLDDVRDLIASAISDSPPATLGEGGVIREGYDVALDELREARDGGRGFIASLQARERERTGIPSLKVGFNRVFGYYIEITRANAERVPDDYERRQTLANAERFVTPELKDWEARVLGAEERIQALEAELFGEVRRAVAEHAARLYAAAEAVAILDVLAAFAHLAEHRGYVRPEVHTGFALSVRGGRHPVVETMMPREEFIPNDVILDEDERVMILTGPNMAGKSTLLRQVGL
ncbi:MAG TPA: DNA mismatch repair protein MutS, partial [Longimicrobiales bacterium]|nr:DNA mismatch repair protein MutS [Longimicrobiales bacterium]